MEFDAVILAGGTGHRLGGVDKAALRVGGRTLLDGVLAAVGEARRVVVVGPERPVTTTRALTWTRESPEGGGPLAGLAAGVAALVRDQAVPVGEGDLVVVLAVDLPHLTAGHVTALTSALARRDEAEGPEAAAYPGEGGRPQLLTAAYRTTALVWALQQIGDPHNAPVRLLRDWLVVADVAADPAGDVLEDCDTPEQLAAARARLGEG